MKRIERAEAKGYTVTLKIKYADFEIVSRSLTQSQPVTELSAITEIASLLLESVELNRPVRLLGIGVSKLEVEDSVERDVQLSFDF
jgi:DNA polymerase-4